MHDPQVSEGTSSLVLWAMRMRSDPTNDELVQHFVDRQRRSPRRFIGTKNKEPPMTPFPLLSDGPHEDLSPSDRLFEPFIGSWDLDVTWYDRGAVTRRARGEWHFAWVLEGRAVQDVWVVPPRGQRHGTDDLYEYGTSIRFPDPSCGGWRSTWIGPMGRVVITFVARPADGDVVLETRLEDGRQMQWRFSEITPASFSWSSATERDGEWIVTQRFAAPSGSRHVARMTSRDRAFTGARCRDQRHLPPADRAHGDRHPAVRTRETVNTGDTPSPLTAERRVV